MALFLFYESPSPETARREWLRPKPGYLVYSQPAEPKSAKCTPDGWSIISRATSTDGVVSHATAWTGHVPLSPDRSCGYYGSWGGWNAEGDARTRLLYVLKQLATRQMWAGRLVHESVERALLSLRDGYSLSEASLIESTVRQMRDEWKGSRDGIYREFPKRTGLFEHEYTAPIRDSEWQALRDNVIRCLRNFYRLPLFADIKATPTDRWVLIEDIGSFQFEGIKVFAAPDFGYWNAADRLQLVDWKTGGAGADAALQLGGYALYALETMGVDPARVDLLEVNLREGKVTTHPWGSLDLDRVRDHIRLSVRSMRAYLKDPDRNLAEEADFEKAEDQRICRWCNFRAVCRPEMAPFAPPTLSVPVPLEGQ